MRLQLKFATSRGSAAGITTAPFQLLLAVPHYRVRLHGAQDVADGCPHHDKLRVQVAHPKAGQAPPARPSSHSNRGRSCAAAQGGPGVTGRPVRARSRRSRRHCTAATATSVAGR